MKSLNGTLSVFEIQVKISIKQYTTIFIYPQIFKCFGLSNLYFHLIFRMNIVGTIVIVTSIRMFLKQHTIQNYFSFEDVPFTISSLKTNQLTTGEYYFKLLEAICRKNKYLFYIYYLIIDTASILACYFVLGQFRRYSFKQNRRKNQLILISLVLIYHINPLYMQQSQNPQYPLIQMLCIVLPVLIIKNKLFISAFLSVIMVLFDRRYVTLYFANMLMSIINFKKDGAQKAIIKLFLLLLLQLSVIILVSLPYIIISLIQKDNINVLPYTFTIWTNLKSQLQEQRYCTNSSNVFTFMNGVSQIITFLCKKIFKNKQMPIIIQIYYQNKQNQFTQWQFISAGYFLFILRIIYNDIYSADDIYSQKPIYLYETLIIILMLSQYNANDILIVQLFALCLILYYLRKLDIQMYFGQRKMKQKRIYQIRKAQTKIYEKQENNQQKMTGFNDLLNVLQDKTIVKQVGKVRSQDTIIFSQQKPTQMQKLYKKLLQYIDVITSQTNSASFSVVLILIFQSQTKYFQIKENYNVILYNLLWIQLINMTDFIQISLLTQKQFTRIQLLIIMISKVAFPEYVYNYLWNSINVSLLCFLLVCNYIVVLSKESDQ